MKTPLRLKGNIWYLQKRVPVRFKGIDPRAYVYISLHTDSRREAERKAQSVLHVV